MPAAPYLRLLGTPGLREVYALGLVTRLPSAASGVLLTLHVVNHLGASWTAAGMLSAVATTCVAVAGPWRGRLLDRYGLRRTVAPTIVVNAAAWSVAPFLGYWPLMLLAGVAGLFSIPIWSIARQAVLAAAPEADRRGALALDSTVVELSWVIGPAGVVAASTAWGTPWVLLCTQMLVVVGGVLLVVVNPALLPADAHDEVHVPRRQWVTPAFVMLLLVATTTTLVLSSTDVALVAATKAMGADSSLGWVIALWSGGSLVGGLVYGALPRPVSAVALIAGLGAVTLPLAMAGDRFTLAALAVVAGALCAPTIIATVDGITHAVPVKARGEAMGWHGSALTIGGALGAPLAGVVIDVWGAGAGFVLGGVVGLLVATAAVGVLWARTRRMPARLST